MRFNYYIKYSLCLFERNRKMLTLICDGHLFIMNDKESFID